MVPGHGRLRLDSRSSFFLDIGKARSDRKQPRRVTSTSIRVMDSVAVGSRSGVAMGWAFPLQSPGHPEFRAENYFSRLQRKLGERLDIERWNVSFMFCGVLCTWVKLSTDLQVLDCELHKNAFGGRATRWGSYSAPDPSCYKGDGRNEREGKGWK